MKIEHMRYVIEVSKWKSINKAASHLYINQQQLSRIIASVESKLETELFIRNTKGIFLTPQGETIVKKFEQIIDIYDHINEQEEKTTDLITGRINIFSEINIWTSYARFYKDFAKAYPNIQCFIRNMATEEILQSLQQQESAGIISRLYDEDGPEFQIPDEFEFHIMSKLPLVVYGANNNPYVKKYKSISMTTLSELPIINYKPYHNYPSLAERAAAKHCTLNIQYEVDNDRVFREMVAETDGLFLAIKKPSYIIDDTITEIPLRNKIFVEHGIIIRKQPSKLYEIFNDYYFNYYKGRFAD